MILVSACLAGMKCRYDGKDNLNPFVLDLVEKGLALPVCPEQLGGLPTPRIPCEIVEGKKVLDRNGQDITAPFLKGAEEVLRLARLCNIKYAIFQERSPSCGVKRIYDGSFSGKLIDGLGITTGLLKNEGIRLFSEENIEELQAELSDILRSSGGNPQD